MPDPIVPPDLRNPSTTPTSELQESYNDLRKFLILRTREELDALSQNNSIEQKQLADNLANKTIAISSLISPDGAFLTKDMPQILKNNLNLKVDNFNSSVRGDISVHGAGKADYDYGDDLLKTVGILTDKFNLDPETKSESLYKSGSKNEKRLSEIIKRQRAINALLEPINVKLSTPGVDLTKAEQEDFDKLSAEYRSLDQEQTKLLAENSAYYKRAGEFQLSKRGTTSVLSSNVNNNANY